MVGVKKSRACPYIIFTSTDKQARKLAQKATRDSGLLTNTEFSLGNLRHPPSEPITEVAMENEPSAGTSDESFVNPQPFIAPCEVFFNPSDRIRVVGMPILIKFGATFWRRATANAVYNGHKFAYVTAAHAFVESAKNAKVLDKDDEDIDLEFDDASLDEAFDDSGFDEDEDDENRERDILSLHSDTYEEESVSIRSLQLLVTPPSRGSSPERNDSNMHLTKSASSESSRQSKSVIDAAQEVNQHQPSIRYRTLGMVLLMVQHLDLAVIDVIDNRVVYVLEMLRRVTSSTRFSSGPRVW